MSDSVTLCHAITIGVRLEKGPIEVKNNTLLRVDDISELDGALVCSTDRKACYINESSDQRDYSILIFHRQLNNSMLNNITVYM